MNTFIVSLSFSEIVDAAIFDETQVWFYAADPTNDGKFHVTGSTDKTTADGMIMSFTLKLEDMNAIKALPGVVADETSTLMTFGTALVSDAIGNTVVAVDATQVLGGGYAADNVSPVIEQFDLNMATGLVTLSFSETVKATANDIDMSLLTIQSHAGSTPSQSHTLSATGATVQSADSHIIQITLSTADMNEIKRLDGVCTTVRCAFSDRNLHSRMSLRIPRMFA
jgi:hypothetical protein